MVPDSTLDKLNQIERLLYGLNYEVTLKLYGPSNPNLGLIETIRMLISDECELSGMLQSSTCQSSSVITNCLLFQGYEGAGPVDLESKKSKITKLISDVFSTIDIESAEMVLEFAFKHGHPAYPVFWDFAYDIHVNGQRWIFVGCSSD